MGGWRLPCPPLLYLTSCCIFRNRKTLRPSNRAETFCKTGLEKNPAAKNRGAGKVSHSATIRSSTVLSALWTVMPACSPIGKRLSISTASTRVFGLLPLMATITSPVWNPAFAPPIFVKAHQYKSLPPVRRQGWGRTQGNETGQQTCWSIFIVGSFPLLTIQDSTTRLSTGMVCVVPCTRFAGPPRWNETTTGRLNT